MKSIVIFFLLVTLSNLGRAVQSDYFVDLEGFQKNNAFMSSRAARLKAGEDLHLSKKLFWTPTAGLSAGKSRLEINGKPGPTTDYWQANASINLFRGGSDWARLNQAEYSEQSLKFSIQNEELRIETLASDLIFKSIYFKEQLRLQQEIQALKLEALKVIKDRYRRGLVPSSEVLKYDVEVVQQKIKVRQAELDLKQNDISVKSNFVDSIKSQTWPFKVAQKLALDLNDKQLALPKIEKKYWDLKSSEANWQATQRGHWPSLDLSVQYQELDVNGPRQKELSTALVLSFPLWSKYETASAASSAFAEYLAADADYRFVVQSGNLEKDFLSSKVEIARMNLMDSIENLEKSKTLYTEILRAFKLGRVSSNDLIAEQGRLLSSENNLIDAQLSFHQTIVDSCVLYGLLIKKCIQ
jgi:outer membrane protein TolC